MPTPSSITASTPLSDTSSIAGTKRTLPKSPETRRDSDNRRKAPKTRRACDHCKIKKLKCTGTLPCDGCSKKNIDCHYDSQYRRGRPPTPPVLPRPDMYMSPESSHQQNAFFADETLTSRATSQGPPGLETAEIEGQFFDPTSNLTFIHRAWKRLALQTQQAEPGVLTGSENLQPLISAGDKPFSTSNEGGLMFVDQAAAYELFKFYFDNCVVTYRVLNQQYCHSWLGHVLSNVHNGQPLELGLGHAKAAIVVNILAIASLRQHKISETFSADDGTSFPLQQSERYFLSASDLTARETGLPRVESAQARILQVLYLLQTSRMNQAWYVFGNTVPIVSALGLHRKSHRYRNGGRPQMDYILSECRKRTFWVVYTIDKYLAVVFGRPRFYHDNDIDQEYPDRVNDEDMTPQGPSQSEPAMDCHIDSLIFHARIAAIIENVSREVYSIKKMRTEERLASAQSFTEKLHEWRQALPPHLGTVRPSSLIPAFSRQVTALKLAYCHAIMHTTRPFLLDHSENASPALEACVTECIGAAKLALEIVDRMFSEATTVIHFLWWMPYVTFCALAVVYVWEIQQKSGISVSNDNVSLFALAERCQSHLAKAMSSDSASRRYSIIIEELRQEARHSPSQSSMRAVQTQQEALMTSGDDEHGSSSMLDNELGSMFGDQGESTTSFQSMLNALSQWQPTDWLDLDSSVSVFLIEPGIIANLAKAFSFFSQLEDSMIY
ncbi:hypothetical protein BHE90_007740 [Fusarium euwallaceae]|uniref:Zn(2)-C6 fungal-type domain-containing protein n=1 Tax=Fusarium euwallaceae TaxID=1147111 RepID=A0A430LPZ2_9HYPO|nr:hypothetical protein BHE90_007740 [Fusarium euwallaceae]